RSWAVRLLCDGHEPSAAARAAFLRLAVNQPSGLVRLYLASVLQRFKHEDRFALAGALAMHGADRDDRAIPLVLWYGIEPAIPKHPYQAVALAEMSGIPRLRRFIARRLADDSTVHLDSLITLMNRLDAPARQLDVVEGMREGLKGRRKVPMPRGWQDAFAKLEKQPATQAAARRLGLIFGDARADAALRRTLTAATEPPDQRAIALESLVEHQAAGVLPLLVKLLDDAAIRGPVLRALAAYNSPEVSTSILRVYAGLGHDEKQAALGTLASRPAYALALLDAVEQKRVPRADVSAFTARQLQD